MKSTSQSRLSNHVKLGYGCAVALWITSLLVTAVELNGSMPLAGHRVFMIGIDALRAGMPGWLANPFLLVALIAGVLHRPGLASALSGVACVLTLSSFYAPTLARARGMPIDEVSYEIGFFLWLAASSLILATSTFAFVRTRRRSS